MYEIVIGLIDGNYAAVEVWNGNGLGPSGASEYLPPLWWRPSADYMEAVGASGHHTWGMRVHASVWPWNRHCMLLDVTHIRLEWRDRLIYTLGAEAAIVCPDGPGSAYVWLRESAESIAAQFGEFDGSPDGQ